MNTSMKKYIKAILNIVIALVILGLVIWLLPRFIVFFMPFIIGWIIACIASPLVRFFEEKLKVRRKAGSAVVIVFVIAMVILALYLICGKLMKEVVSFAQDLPAMWSSLESDFEEISDNLEVVFDKLPRDAQTAINNTLDSVGERFNELAMDVIGRLSSPTIAAVGNFAKQLPTVIIGIIMCLLSSYFFVAERGQWAASLRKALPEPLLYRFRLIKRSMGKAVGGYFKAQLKIEVWIYLMLVVGLAALRVDYVLLIALGIAVLDFLPFFGTGTVMVPWAIVKFLSADYKMTIGLLLIWGVGQLVRQVIQPKIVGDSMGMPPLPTLFLLYIGYMLGGVIGMIVAVPIGIILETMYKEGAFDTTRNSLQILSAGLNRFRKLTPQDLAVVDSYKRECEEEVEEQELREQELREQEAQEQKTEKRDMRK